MGDLASSSARIIKIKDKAETQSAIQEISNFLFCNFLFSEHLIMGTELTVAALTVYGSTEGKWEFVDP